MNTAGSTSSLLDSVSSPEVLNAEENPSFSGQSEMEVPPPSVSVLPAGSSLDAPFVSSQTLPFGESGDGSLLQAGAFSHSIGVMVSPSESVADDPTEILSMIFLETPEEAQADQCSARSEPVSSPRGNFNPTARTERFVASPANKGSGRASDSIRSGRTSPKSQAQAAREKKARLLLLLGTIFVNATFLALAILHYTGRLGSWLGY